MATWRDGVYLVEQLGRWANPIPFRRVGGIERDLNAVAFSKVTFQGDRRTIRNQFAWGGQYSNVVCEKICLIEKLSLISQKMSYQAEVTYVSCKYNCSFVTI